MPPLLVACAMLMMYKMSSTPFSNAPIHTWSLSAGLMCLFHPAGFHNVSAFLCQNTISSISSLMH